MITIRKIGGITFLRIGRLQFSYCLCKRSATTVQSRSATKDGGLSVAQPKLTLIEIAQRYSQSRNQERTQS